MRTVEEKQTGPKGFLACARGEPRGAKQLKHTPTHTKEERMLLLQGRILGIAGGRRMLISGWFGKGSDK